MHEDRVVDTDWIGFRLSVSWVRTRIRKLGTFDPDPAVQQWKITTVLYFIVRIGWAKIQKNIIYWMYSTFGFQVKKHDIQKKIILLKRYLQLYIGNGSRPSDVRSGSVQNRPYQQ
jgi:hypothetical protein